MELLLTTHPMLQARNRLAIYLYNNNYNASHLLYWDMHMLEFHPFLDIEVVILLLWGNILFREAVLATYKQSYL